MHISKLKIIHKQKSKETTWLITFNICLKSFLRDRKIRQLSATAHFGPTFIIVIRLHFEEWYLNCFYCLLSTFHCNSISLFIHSHKFFCLLPKCTAWANRSDGVVDRAFVSDAVYAGSIPVLGQAEDFRKLAITASLLGVQHYKGIVWRQSQQVGLLCPWERHLIPPAMSGRQLAIARSNGWKKYIRCNSA